MGLTSDAKAILWVDLETTGTDETEDDIIEVGAILTDFDLEVIRMFSAVSRPSDHAYKRMMENKVVRKMHTDNGLLAILDKLPPDFGDLRKVDADFVKFRRWWIRYRQRFVKRGKTCFEPLSRCVVSNLLQVVDSLSITSWTSRVNVSTSSRACVSRARTSSSHRSVRRTLLIETLTLTSSDASYAVSTAI
jgi:hypothetical protein